MKKLLVITFIFIINFLFSQTDKDYLLVKKINVDYIQIIGSEKLTNDKMDIIIDFGQNGFLSKNEINNQDEKFDKKFNSMIDALNFMYTRGYSLQSVYTNTKNDIVRTYYVLKKDRSTMKWFSN